MIPTALRPSQARRAAVHSRVGLTGLAGGLAGLVLAAGAMAGGAAAQEGRTIRIADRCSLYGTGFVDIGDGTCARVVRQYGETGSRAIGQGTAGGSAGNTSHAALRSDGILPGAADAGHLRVPGGLYGR